MTAGELHITLSRREVDSYDIELRFTDPNGREEVFARDDSMHTQIRADDLRDHVVDPAEYGRQLASRLFAPDEAHSVFIRARTVCETLDAALRIRLHIGPDAAGLQALRWETLCDPETQTPLFTNERIQFCRHLSHPDWRPLAAASSQQVRVLSVMANPSDTDRYEVGGFPLSPLTDEVVDAVRRGLRGIEHVELSRGPAAAGPPTLGQILSSLRDQVEVLIVLAHGYIAHGQSYLLLEREDGTAEAVTGRELAERIGQLEKKPRLVMMVSCQSAGTDDPAEEQSALGPAISSAGVAAVLAMRGNVSIETMEEFLPALLRSLRRDGDLDLAVAVARASVSHRPDWWAPVLFSRSKSGRIWFRPGFADSSSRDLWTQLTHYIRRGNCTPVLGPGLLDGVFGPRRVLARKWAERYRFPMAKHLHEDLPQVAQFVWNMLGAETGPELATYVSSELLRRYGNDLPPDLRTMSVYEPKTLSRLVAPVGNILRGRNSTEPHRILADLPFSVYLTADQMGFLEDAMAVANKPWRKQISEWRTGSEGGMPALAAGGIGSDDDDYYPSPDEPLIYHLFGHIEDPASMVLTEDDYLDYLIGVTKNHALIPDCVKVRTTTTLLLFLGFRMEEWEFRVLFRSMMSFEGRDIRSKIPHVAVQLDPDEDRTLDPVRARRYLEDYFSSTANVSIYWGSAEEFLSELQSQWRQELAQP
jgi:CHAT domain/SIR2-like domain